MKRGGARLTYEQQQCSIIQNLYTCFMLVFQPGHKEVSHKLVHVAAVESRWRYRWVGGGEA